jgi:4-aminobutyrate aminotransferase
MASHRKLSPMERVMDAHYYRNLKEETMQGTYPRKAKITKITEEIIDRDQQFFSPSYTRDFDFVVEGGRGREVIDVEGNYYLDFGAGIAVTSTGHCHPKVVKAIHQQSSKLIHMAGTDFYYRPQVDLAEKLSKITTRDYEPDRMAFFCNSGAEAVEAAMKLARFHTKRSMFIAFTGAFHGRTLGALSLTGSKAIQKKHYQPLQPVVHAPYADCGNCMFGSTAKKCQKNSFKCLSYLEDEIFTRIAPPEDVAAVFVEALQGEGGYIVPPEGWMAVLSDMCADYNILLVVDEIQSGIGRTGKWFAHHYDDVDADIITMAKGIASGMPLGAIVAQRKIMESWEYGSHANTFGGNPIACAAALATLNVIEEEELMENAVARGLQIHEMLESMCLRDNPVRNPRGRGLMRAVDVGQDDGVDRTEIINRCFAKGLILLGCGKAGIRFCPALNVTKNEVNTAMYLLETELREMY